MPTSAHRLHDLLRAVHAQGRTEMPAARGKALGAEPGTAEFARRHVQAMVLLADTTRDVDALPASVRDRCSVYLPAWWRAVITISQHQHSPISNAARSVIATSDLDHLASAGGIIGARMGGTSLAPADVSLERLAADVEDWRMLLDETDGLPAGLAAQLRAQLDHLLWLIEQAPLFGTSSVARQADEALGALSRASDTVKGPATWQKWKTGYAALVQTITLLTAGTVRAFESDVQAIDGVRDALDAFGGEQPGTPAQRPAP